MICLLDIETADGTRYFFADVAGSYTSVLTGSEQQYSAWLKSWGPIRQSRTLATDAGNIVLQNLAGNLIDRALGKDLVTREFEGALCVLRLIEPLTEEVTEEMHGSLSEPEPGETEVSFRLLQLADLNAQDVPDDEISEKCTLRYKSDRCGSVSGLASCNKTFSDCSARGATERFNGVPVIRVI